MSKVAFISEQLPPSKTGQAMVLYRLLQGFEPQDYCLISQHDWNAEGGASQRHGKLPGKYYHLTSRLQLRRGYRFGLSHLRENFNLLTGVFFRARQITEILQRERCDAVVACTGDLLDLPAGYLASRRTALPFYAYIFDHYSYREWQNRTKRFWAKRLERLLMREAAGVITPNEILCEDLRRQYGIEPTVIHNSFDTTEYEAVRNEAPAPDNGEVKIVYTGDIYEAHYDAFRNLLAAIERLGRRDVKLHLYTTRTLEELAEVNIRGAIVRHDFVSPGEMPRTQRQADLLFLPLAFNSPYPDLVRTSATTKLGEYLGANRPVLVHAPPDSFVAWYFRKHQCGVVVDRCDPSALAEAIEAVLSDKDLQRRLGERAWERAQGDFSVSTARRKFLELIGRGRAPDAVSQTALLPTSSQSDASR